MFLLVQILVQFPGVYDLLWESLNQVLKSVLYLNKLKTGNRTKLLIIKK